MPEAHITSEHDGAPRVSVIVCGRNGAHFLPTLVGALHGQTLPPSDFEVIYVDDASDDDSPSVMEASGAARVIRCQAHIGLPQARNRGIEASCAPVLAFTDTDTIPEPDWLERGLRRFDEEGADMVGGGINIPVGPRPSIAAMVDATTFLDQEMYIPTGYAAGANMWATREFADRVGGFSDELEAYGGDDEDFGQRITAAGGKLIYAPDALLSHPPRTRLRDIAKKSYMLGLSQAARRRMSSGRFAGQTPVYTQARAYFPPKRLRRLPRIARLEYQPTVLELLAIHAARYFCVQLAGLYGDFIGERRRRAGASGEPKGHVHDAR